MNTSWIFIHKETYKVIFGLTKTCKLLIQRKWHKVIFWRITRETNPKSKIENKRKMIDTILKIEAKFCFPHILLSWTGVAIVILSCQQLELRLNENCSLFVVHCLARNNVNYLSMKCSRSVAKEWTRSESKILRLQRDFGGCAIEEEKFFLQH